jgi:hypothetical protein
LRDIRQLLDGARAQHNARPHKGKDPRLARDEDFGYEDEDEEDDDEEADDDGEVEDDEEKAEDTTMDMEETVEEAVTLKETVDVDNSLKSMSSSDVGSSMPAAATSEVELPAKASPKAVDDDNSKSWAGLTPKIPKISAELPFRTTKSTQPDVTLALSLLLPARCWCQPQEPPSNPAGLSPSWCPRLTPAPAKKMPTTLLRSSNRPKLSRENQSQSQSQPRLGRKSRLRLLAPRS